MRHRVPANAGHAHELPVVGAEQLANMVPDARPDLFDQLFFRLAA
jgi:hypothetical protein